MTQAETQQTLPEEISRASSTRQCWICYATDEDEDAPDPPQWTQPCQCKGTTKWAHQKCLLTFVEMKLKAAKDARVLCPQCKTTYTIYYPSTNSFASLLGKLDSAVYVCCPFITGIVTVTLVYWSAFTFGTIVLVQVVGLEKTVEIFSNQDSAPVLFITLPLIPILLFSYNMVRWEDQLLEILRKMGRHSPPFFRPILPESVSNASVHERSLGVSGGMSCTRICAGTFLLPTIAVLTGKLLYGNTIESPVTRALLGGLTYSLVTGLFTMYLKQKNYLRVRGMKILDYIPPQYQASPGTGT